VQTHIVHGAITFLQNVEKCVTRAGLEVIEEVLEPIASGDSVLLPTEKDLGVCLVDIGGGTSDVAVFVNGSIYYSAVIPVGGNHVTNDIAEGLKVGQSEAERLKMDSGCALIELVPESDVITVQQVGREEARKLRRRALAQIIEPRMQELLELVREELKEADCWKRLPFGLVISGGGSQLKGCLEIAQQVMELPVRIGRPQPLGGLGETLTHPMYATAIGLLKYGASQLQAAQQESRQSAVKSHPRGIGRLWAWIRETFGV
jgi:cell division protein FtsA